MNRVAVEPALLRWARDRAGHTPESLRSRFPRLGQRERREVQPTLKQLEAFARAVHVPIGYLFLREPPTETVPIPDLRTIESREIRRPSPDLLDTVYLCQSRQSWYREWARTEGEGALAFVGSATLSSSIEDVATRIREALGFDLDARRACPTWTDALRQFVEQADRAGILVMVSGVVGSNNRRGLDPEEFRGFALADAWAPLVFVNGNDTKAAQMFTLVHELAHVWLGESALSDTGPASRPTQRVESWCNRVAAELLVPLAALREDLSPGDPLDAVSSLARRFKVSTLVILRRLLDARRVDRDTFERAYREELERLRARPKGSGGNFYLTQTARLSRRFARAVLGSTLEGQTLYRDAMRMLCIRSTNTLHEFGRNLGYPI